MKITLKDGSVKEYEESRSIIDIAYDISEGLARAACAGEVDGGFWILVSRASARLLTAVIITILIRSHFPGKILIRLKKR